MQLRTSARRRVILPSRREGLPVVALEALALERPVVATDVGGTSTAIVDGETGWLVPPEDPSALAAAIIDCLADPAEAGDGPRRREPRSRNASARGRCSTRSRATSAS